MHRAQGSEGGAARCARIAGLALCGVALAPPSLAGDCAEWEGNAYFQTASVTEVADCVRAGTDLSSRGALGRTPLHIAAMHNDSPFVIAALVAAGAEPRMRDERDHTPLHSAAMASDHPEIIKALIRAGADPRAPSLPATMEDFLPPVGVSSFGTYGFELWGTPWYFDNIETYRDPDDEPISVDDPIVATALLGGENPKLFALLVELATRASGPSLAAARAGSITGVSPAERAESEPEDDLGTMTELLNILKERESRGIRPVHVAARFNRNAAVLAALLDAGADAGTLTVHDFSPLHIAASFNHSAEVIATLAEAGADPNGRDIHGGTPLHVAATVGRAPAVIKALIDAGADVEARDERGRTPLHRVHARYDPSTAMVAALLAAGADITARDSRGRQPGEIRHW